MVSDHYVILPLSAELKQVLHEHAAMPTLPTRTPFSLVDVLIRFQHTETFFLFIRYTSLVSISVLIDTRSGRTDLLIIPFSWFFNQSVLLPVVVLENALIFPKRLAILTKWT